MILKYKAKSGDEISEGSIEFDPERIEMSPYKISDADLFLKLRIHPDILHLAVVNDEEYFFSETLDLAVVEKAAINRALELVYYNQKEAALLLNISVRVLNYKIGQLGITHPSWRKHHGEKLME